MYLLKPYLAVFGALLLAASYFMVFKTDEAIIFYLGVLSATTEQGELAFSTDASRRRFPSTDSRSLFALSLARAFCVVCVKQRGPGSSPSTSRRGGA